MGKRQQQQLDIQMQQGPATVVNIPPNATIDQEVVLEREQRKGSKFKSFFSRNKKAKVVLSERDAEILRQVKRRAKILDTGLNLGCARIGLDPIIGKSGSSIVFFSPCVPVSCLCFDVVTRCYLCSVVAHIPGNV
jgi:hypothetical protein